LLASSSNDADQARLFAVIARSGDALCSTAAFLFGQMFPLHAGVGLLTLLRGPPSATCWSACSSLFRCGSLHAVTFELVAESSYLIKTTQAFEPSKKLSFVFYSKFHTNFE
jgi:hypothetical protein